MVEDAGRRGAEVLVDHLVAQWAVRHAEWTQNILVKSDVDLRGGFHMEHTLETKHRAMLLELGNEFLFEAKSTMTNNPDFWSVGHLGHKDPDIITLMADGSVWYKGSWKYSSEGRSVANVHELQTALGERKTRNQRCKVVWRANMELMYTR